MKRFLYILFITPICLLSVLTMIYLFSSNSPLFVIKNVKLKGLNQLQDSEVMGRVSPFVKDSIFNIDVSKIKEAIISHPFVEDVRIKRIFPFSVVIDVQEKKPFALWVDNQGNIKVLDGYGEPYRDLAKGTVKGMFIINTGEKEDIKKILKEVNLWISQGLIKKDDISEVVSRNCNITLFLVQDSIEIILGKEELMKRLKRAMVVLEDAKKRGLLIKCIDARFEKGAIIQERQV
ncbi:MAG TPA: FtsQ-type POTRA domain-containing protein [Syntrophorhabdaceae bacterium]|nr:FtsQ-type POTRA domain-containing protein [Syntrophorhabdaceae bacterium]